MKINIPEDIKKDLEFIINELAENNHKCYLVGGCVRDSLLGREPKDWDLATSATTQEMYKIFCDKLLIVPTGEEFGTLTFVIEDKHYEITTFRGDKYNEDERENAHHPFSVEFVDDIEEDLARRDFTINAMAYHLKTDELIDPFRGRSHLDRKIIMAVGKPGERFIEDPLRMLRAVRFSAQLGFKISDKLSQKIWEYSNLIRHISPERIQAELNKILLSNPAVLNQFASELLMQEIIPELTDLRAIKQNSQWHVYDAYEHSIKATEIVEPELHLRLAMLLHDLGKYDTLTTDEKGIDHFYNHGTISHDKAKAILKRLRYSNEIVDKVCLLIKEHDRRIELSKKAVKKVLNLMGEEATRDLLKIRWADICAQNLVYLKPRAKKVFDLTALVEEVIENKEPFSRKDLAINGDDLINIGFKPGRDIGLVLNQLLELVIKEPSWNKKDILTVYANGLLSNMDTLKLIK